MASIVLAGSSSGSVTVAAPAAAGSTTLTLPAVTGTVITSTSPAASLSTASGSAPSYSARAWVNFDGSVAAADMIRASGNVSSIIDNGTGDYTVNFTTAMPDANYAVSLSTVVMNKKTNDVVTPRTAGAIDIRTYNSANAASNSSFIDLVAFR